MSHLVCYQCEHCYLINADVGYSDATPSTEMYFACRRDHWEFNKFHDNLNTLTHYLEQANTCPDFTPRSDTNVA